MGLTKTSFSSPIVFIALATEPIFVLDAFNQHVIGGGVPAHETIGPQIWDYGETIADDYVFSLYEECSPSDDPYDLFEDDDIVTKQLAFLQNLASTLDAEDLQLHGIDESYLDLAKGFIEYAADRMEGGG